MSRVELRTSSGSDRINDTLPQSQAEWLACGFRTEFVDVDGRAIKCAISSAGQGSSLTIMVGGIPKDPDARKNLPLVNKLLTLRRDKRSFDVVG